jgi:hypothetical protein
MKVTRWLGTVHTSAETSVTNSIAGTLADLYIFAYTANFYPVRIFLVIADYYCGRWCSTVGMETRLRDRRSGVESRRDKGLFSYFNYFILPFFVIKIS